ncbi:MAG: TRAP transporter substrate-binding protein [Lachnospiraceae bacterium]|jgi:tripartite ATP-independent transporter DctP family solute receptor|nr:TRAP transporter substrate-binding protein [Lachnospiraceae bacterium]MCI9635157.1 TRAP transporter substrate-binding protein [Hungatella sp.]
MKLRNHAKKAAALAAAAALTLTACGGGSSAGSSQTASGEQSFNLKLSHGLAEDHAVHIQMTEWAADVKEKSGGTISIQIIPNGQLGSEADNISSIQAGGLDMAKVSASTLGNFNSTWDALSVPYVFNDKDHFYKVMDGEIAQELYKMTEGDGFIGLTWLDSGARSFYTAKTPVRVPSDLKGLKIRTMDSQMAIDMMNALGGSATVMSYSEIYTGMQQGVVDGAENNITALRDHSDVAQYYCYDEHTRIPDIIVISAKVWNQMSDSQKKIMTETAAAATESYKTRWAEFEEEVKTAAQQNNVTFVEDVDTAAFQEACQSIYENLKSSSPDVYAVVEKIQNAGK